MFSTEYQQVEEAGVIETPELILEPIMATVPWPSAPCTQGPGC